MLCRRCRWSPLGHLVPSVMAAPLCGFFAVGGHFFPGGCLAVGGTLGGCVAAVGFWVPSVADALLPKACGPSSWRMLGRHGRLVFVGGCFATVAVGSSYVLSGWMLSHYSFVYLVGNPGLLFLLQAQL